MPLFSTARITAWAKRMLKRAWSILSSRRHAATIAATAADRCRSRRDLLIENAVLRHQLGILRRKSERPRLTLVDRLKLLLGARLLGGWRAVSSWSSPRR